MMKRTLAAAGIALAVGLAAQHAVQADGHAEPHAGAIKARKAQMQLYAFNLGLLGDMAKDKAPYDAEIAQGAANNLLAAASLDGSAMWPEGSDVESPGMLGKTRAKPEAWTTYPKVREKGDDLVAAATKMAADAGNGLDAVKANMGAVGKTCKGCHEDFRAPKPK